MTAGVLGLAFSRDRALQLDATLRSYLRHVADPRLAEVIVLYTTSSPRHAAQYAELIEAFAGTPGLRFVAEGDFRSDVLQTLATGAGLSEPRRTALRRVLELSPGKLAARLSRALLVGTRVRKVLFLVDDNLFVRAFDLAGAVGLLDERPEALGFSLRLGRNVTYCYALDRPQALPAFQPVAAGIAAYDWTVGEHDFGYPLELSSSLYRIADVLPMLARRRFANPNQMEARLAADALRFRSRRPTLICYERSVTFCNPINRVQDEYENRAGEQFGHSAERLADVYDSSRRIDVAAYDDFVPEACHQEVELALRPAATGS